MTGIRRIVAWGARATTRVAATMDDPPTATWRSISIQGALCYRTPPI
jgi:hypothetical protein